MRANSIFLLLFVLLLATQGEAQVKPYPNVYPWKPEVTIKKPFIPMLHGQPLLPPKINKEHPVTLDCGDGKMRFVTEPVYRSGVGADPNSAYVNAYMEIYAALLGMAGSDALPPTECLNPDCSESSELYVPSCRLDVLESSLGAVTIHNVQYVSTGIEVMLKFEGGFGVTCTPCHDNYPLVYPVPTPSESSAIIECMEAYLFPVPQEWRVVLLPKGLNDVPNLDQMGWKNAIAEEWLLHRMGVMCTGCTLSDVDAECVPNIYWITGTANVQVGMEQIHIVYPESVLIACQCRW